MRSSERDNILEEIIIGVPTVLGTASSFDESWFFLDFFSGTAASSASADTQKYDTISLSDLPPDMPQTREEILAAEVKRYCQLHINGARRIEEILDWTFRLRLAEAPMMPSLAPTRQNVEWMAAKLQPSKEAFDIQLEADMIRRLRKKLNKWGNNDPNKIYMVADSIFFPKLSQISENLRGYDEQGVYHDYVDNPRARFHLRVLAKFQGNPTSWQEGCGVESGTYIYHRPSSDCLQNGIHNVFYHALNTWMRKAQYGDIFTVPNVPRESMQQTVWGHNHGKRLQQAAGDWAQVQAKARSGKNVSLTEVEKAKMQEFGVSKNSKAQYVAWIVLGAQQNEQDRYFIKEHIV